VAVGREKFRHLLFEMNKETPSTGGIHCLSLSELAHHWCA